MTRAVRCIALKVTGRLILDADRTGGVIAWSAYASGLGFGGTGALVGARLAPLFGADIADWAFSGFLIAMSILMAFTLYVVGVYTVLWLSGRSPGSLLNRSGADRGGPDPRTVGRHAAPSAREDPNGHWRKRGYRLLSHSAPVARFFALMIVFAASEWVSACWAPDDLPSGDRVVTTGRVIGFEDAPFYRDDPRSIVVT